MSTAKALLSVVHRCTHGAHFYGHTPLRLPSHTCADVRCCSIAIAIMELAHQKISSCQFVRVGIKQCPALF